MRSGLPFNRSPYRLSWLHLAIACLSVLIGSAAFAQGVPGNASRWPGGGWTCNSGFLKRAESCIAIADATDAEIKQLIISRSIAAYSGSCPCPFNTDRAGRRCGARSAYSRPGGASPLCFDNDVSQKMVDDLRQRAK